MSRFLSLLTLLIIVGILSPPATGRPAEDSLCVGLSGNDGIAACTRVIARGGPNLAQKYYNRGVMYNDQGDRERALADYNESIRLDPTEYRGYWMRGRIYHFANDLERALSDYNEVIRLEPTYANAYINRARVYILKGDPERAISDATEAIRLEPEEPLAYANRGVAYKAKGDIERSRADLMEAFRLKPTLKYDDARAALASLSVSSEVSVSSPQQPIQAAVTPPVVPLVAGRRVALVIGNGAYQNVSALPNPVNDASDVSAALSRLNFAVKTVSNAKYDDMRRALIDFGRQAAGAEIALIFFAGHGIQMGGENWLIPIDAQLASDRDVAAEAIGLQMMTRAVSSTTKLGMIILDACRNNPFVPKMQATNVARDVERGFSRVEPSDNVLVAYASRDGTTAKDGSGRNSPFTKSLLANIEKPGLEIRFLLAQIREDVMQATNKEQQPFIYGSLSPSMIYLAQSK